MEPTVYRKTSVFNWKDGMFLIWLCSLVVVVDAISRLISWELQDSADRIRHVIVVLFAFLVAAGWFYMTLPRRNQLQLDEDGLTYMRANGRGTWPWRDISAFTLVRGWRGPRIEFTVSRDDGRWRTGPLSRTKAGLTGTIPNIWDTPLDDIAETLNAYRERAVGDSESVNAGPRA